MNALQDAKARIAAVKQRVNEPKERINALKGLVASLTNIVQNNEPPKAKTKWNYNELKKNFKKHTGQQILRLEYDAGKENTNNKLRWEGLFGSNTCAIRLSYALNNAGYPIPEHLTIQNRLTWTSNINSQHQYILGADEMGNYLKQKLGNPSIQTNGVVTKDTEITELMGKFEKWEDYKGIIYLDSKNHKNYGASGHVDLIYEDWGKDPHILGSSQELDDYLDWRNGDGLFNTNAQLQVFIWFLEGNLK